MTALQNLNLEPVVAQRAVCDEASRVATAADIVCYDGVLNRLVVVELKCGFSGDRTTAATRGGKACRMRGVLRRAADTVLNRHLSQLSATRAFFVSEPALIDKIVALGIDSEVAGLLLYVDDAGSTTFELPSWWTARGLKILRF
jgi:hypothetical protein